MRTSVSFLGAFLGLSLFALQPPVHAAGATSAESYWYLGGDLGYARDKFTTSRPGWATDSANNATLGVRGGYQFNRFLSVEGGLGSLGEIETKVGNRKDKFSLGAASLNVVGHWPLTDRLALLGIAGLSYESGRRRGDVESTSKSKSLLNLGVGVSYDVTDNWRVRAQYIDYGKLEWKGNNATIKSQQFTVGVDYKFR